MRALIAFTAAALLTITLVAEEKPAATSFTIGEGKLALQAPEGWVKKQPRSRIIEAEFEIPAAEGDEQAGRLTAMGAGGSVEANIDRWAAQFATDKDAAKSKVDKQSIGGCEVHVVDLAGTYKDTPGGPFAGGKTILRDDYRMLGAIIVTEKAGNYFLKLYGPKATIDANEKGFQSLVKSLKVK